MTSLYIEFLVETFRVFLLTVILFSLTWYVGKGINNWSIIDFVWSYSFALCAGVYLVTSWSELSSPVIVFLFCVGIWSVRLGTHLAQRTLSEIEREDVRYQKMRDDWGEDAPFRMFRFYVFQAIALTFLCLPLIASVIHQRFNPSETSAKMGILHWAGLSLVVFALLFETLADSQLKAFKEEPENKGKVCDQGLWAWTRHPNYFGEWLVWIGFALLSCNSSFYGVPGVICAGTMFYLLTKVTGIPMTEERLIASRGQSYRDYQNRVSAFWPRPPKNKKSAG